MGRPALDPKKRTYFMKKDVTSSEVANNKMQRTFEFILESTEEGEKLLDVYVGVEFSIIVSNWFWFMIIFGFSIKSRLRQI